MINVIEEKLREIEHAENVRIIMAVESGSRAWGFESPDSDYDVRFIYVRNARDYLRLDEVRDVIEWQLDDVLDINGWDMKKALKLLYTSNPTVFEWCSSPIIYRTSTAFDELKDLKDLFFSPKKSLYHYWHMAENNYRAYFKEEEVRIKKYFYVLRPLLAAAWIIDRKTPPPMLFSELMAEELDSSIEPEVKRLLELKQITPEMGTAPRIHILDDYIDNRLQEFKTIADNMTDTRNEWEPLNEYFLSLFADSQEYIKPEIPTIDTALISLLIKATKSSKLTKTIFADLELKEEKREMIKYLVDNDNLTVGQINRKAFEITAIRKGFNY